MPRISQAQIDAARSRGLTTVPVPGDYKRGKGGTYTGPGGVTVGSRQVSNSTHGVTYEARQKAQTALMGSSAVSVRDLGYRNEWRTYSIKGGDPAAIDAFLRSLPDDRRIWIVAHGKGTSGGESRSYLTVLDNSENITLRPVNGQPSARMQELISNSGAMSEISDFIVYVKE